ncbi:SDR family NAD(P)-dependent oxidoreductase [Kineosporia succinea]|uniref:NAD(P)-dependent dehydrogenase (Short-subunit alcohol dehydrogenase family) n=1 Tax=Kineosporia succinea TaxID=84632 RepID=A0ABT9P6J4_9ACTN|nr:SDR family NAD(P)-dependent oxidoreductase [Kineosporia succinea]MDP9828319.1 NAD(P)-dependent dehydrogenase (short-subunit alcohol dehydrogenase family) [Kineosporia succinea]
MPITTPFDEYSTAAQVVAGTDLTGKRAIVTGAASGIGVETARALAGAGAQVTIAVRDLEAGERTAATIPGSAVEHLDLSDQASVRALAERWQGPLHILVNNAGVMASPLSRTAEGWESQFATNHFGHFALAVRLHDALAAAHGARVVAVSSSAHHRAGIDFDDIHFERRAYEPWTAYGQSKTANVLFAVEGAKRWAADGITVNALNPGGIRTNLQRHVSDEELEALRTAAAAGGEELRWKSVEEGAATSVLLAASPLVAGVTGTYFDDCAEAPLGRIGARHGVSAHALDPQAAERLWDYSVTTLGL